LPKFLLLFSQFYTISLSLSNPFQIDKKLFVYIRVSHSAKRTGSIMQWTMLSRALVWETESTFPKT